MRLVFAAGISLLFLACSSEVVTPSSSGGAGSTMNGSSVASSTSHAQSSVSQSGNTTASATSSNASTGSTVPSDCTASNYLSHDSFDVVAEALTNCFNQGTTCPTHTATSIFLPNLDEGNGDVTFDYADDADGTHSLVGHGSPDTSAAPTGIILVADHIPADVSLDNALSNLYFDNMTFACTWQ